MENGLNGLRMESYLGKTFIRMVQLLIKTNLRNLDINKCSI